MIAPITYNRQPIRLPDLSYHVDDMVIVSVRPAHLDYGSLYTRNDGDTKRRMRVVAVYDYIIKCADINGDTECFTVGDVYTGVVRKIKTE